MSLTVLFMPFSMKHFDKMLENFSGKTSFVFVPITNTKIVLFIIFIHILVTVCNLKISSLVFISAIKQWIVIDSK